MAARNPGGQERGEELAPRISRAAIFFLAVFFRVTHDGLSERGTTRRLEKRRKAIKGFGVKRVT